MTKLQLERIAKKRNAIEAKIKVLYQELEDMYGDARSKEDGTYSIRRSHPAYGIPSFTITRYEPCVNGGVYCIPVGEEDK